MRLSITVSSLGLLLALAGCGNDEAAQQQAAAQLAAQQAAAAAQLAAAQQAAQQAAAQLAAQQAAVNQQAAQLAAAQAQLAAASNVSLMPGFMPDPHIVSGVAGGPIQAGSLSAGCNGWVSAAPSHTLTSTVPFGDLRIFARSATDTTLIVQRADGSFICNDDAEGLDPMVTGPLPAGTTRIWVGSYMQSSQAQYRLGFSELSSQGPSQLQI